VRGWCLILVVAANTGCASLLGIGDTTEQPTSDAAAAVSDGAMDAPVTPDVRVAIDATMVADVQPPGDGAVIDAPILIDGRPPDAGIVDAPGVAPDASPLFTATPMASAIRAVRGGDPATVTVTVSRLDGFTGPITLMIDILPIDTSSAMVIIPATVSAGTVAIKADSGAPLGPTSLTIVATGGGWTARAVVSLMIADPPGVVDTSFNGGTIVEQPFGAGPSLAGPILARPSGATVYVAARAANGQSAETVVAQLDAAGQPDRTFGGQGTTQIPGFRMTSAALAPDGAVIVCGFDDTGVTSLVRLDDLGNIDGSWGGGPRPDAGAVAGQVVDLTGVTPTSVAVQSTGAIVYAQTNVGNGDQVVCRLHANGVVDASFASGAGCYSTPNTHPSALVLAVDGSDQIYVAGTWGSPSAFYLAQLTPDGAKVQELSYPTPANAFLANAVTVSNGEPVAAGEFIPQSSESLGAMTRLASGIPDTSFGNSIVEGDFGDAHKTVFEGVATQPDGEIVVVGETSSNGSTVGVIARYHANGTIDANFGTSGVTLVSGANHLYNVTVAADGRILVSGLTAQSTLFLGRYWN
jgi:uncharacterized delta-60 repeat protein